MIINKDITDLIYIAQEKKLNVNVPRMYEAFYQQHKNMTGSYATTQKDYYKKIDDDKLIIEKD